MVAAGQQDGLVKIFDMLSPQSTSLNIVTQSKSCNALSFNSQGLLAAGYEKSGRAENSLHIYNINHYSSVNINQDITHSTLSFVPNESVVSTIFYNETNLLVGSPKILRDVDIRMQTPVFQVPTKTPFSITPDPYNEFSFAAFAEDGTLSVYDRRKLGNNSPDPILSFSKLLGDTTRRNNTSCFRYSGSCKNEFATSHGGELIRRWQIGDIPSSKYEQLFVSCVFDVKTKYDRVISFDYCDTGFGKPFSLVCMRQTGSVFRMPIIINQYTARFNPFNDMIMNGDSGVFIEKAEVGIVNKFGKLNLNDGNEDSKKLEDRSNSTKTKDEGSDENSENSINDVSDEDDNTNAEEEEDGDENGSDNINMEEFFTPEEVLSNDIDVKMRRRALMGYGFEAVTNVQIIDSLKSVDNNLFLRSTWRWMEISSAAADNGEMTTKNLDLSYEGILGIWKGFEDLHKQDRYKSSDLKNEVFKQQINQILARRGNNSMSIAQSNKEPQRRLCMIVAGWYFTQDELQQIFNKMKHQGQYTKAAGWAVFMGDITTAVNILSSSKSGRLKLIATAIAGYLVQKESVDNSLWKEQCREMASELDDPYLRAIFAYIADNDWWDVLDESSLPLRERVGVALKCLSDKDLTIYLNRIAKRYIERGELEGLILTGISPKGIDLLQCYVDRTSDVQTAALITGFGCPKYVQDERVDNWVFSYRDLLNRWSMFSTRAKFDVARAKLSVSSKTGQLTLPVANSQIQVQCTRCNKNIFKPASSKSLLNNGKPKSISSCPHCGTPLPRCSICLLPLGKQLPISDTVIKNQQAKLFSEWPSFCLTCNHGMHAGHAEEWFSRSKTCPVPGCTCRCNNKY